MTGDEVVRIGQVWESCDRRDNGRRVKVLEIHDQTADGLQFDEPYAIVQSPDGRGRKSRIRLSRFRPVTSGYRLIAGAS